MNRRWKTWLGMVLSLGLLGWIVLSVGLEDLALSFAGMDSAWMFPMVGLFAAGLILRAWRWQCLLAPARKVSMKDCGNIILVGNFANNLLPAKGGDVARAVILSRCCDVRFLFGLTSVAVERIFDGLALLLILQVAGLAVNLAPTFRSTMRDISFGAGALFIGALAGLVAARAFPGMLGWFRALVSRLPGSLGSKAAHIVAGLQDSLFFIRPDREFTGFAALSLIVWLIEGLTVWAGFRAFSVPGSAIDAYFTFAIMNFGGLLPSAPGSIGIHQASTVLSFSMLDLPMQAAIPLSLVVQAVQILFNSILGLGAMRQLHLSFSFFRSKCTEAAPSSDNKLSTQDFS